MKQLNVVQQHVSGLIKIILCVKIMTHCDYNTLYFCLEQIQERREE